MESIAQELNRVKDSRNKDYWQAMRALETLKTVLADLLSSEFDDVYISNDDDIPVVKIYGHGQDHKFIEEQKAWWESNANVFFEDKLITSYGASVELTGYITRISTDADSEKLVKVIIHGPPTAKCVRVLKRKEDPGQEYRPAETQAVYQ